MKLIRLSLFIFLTSISLDIESQVINHSLLLKKEVKLYEKAEWDISVSSYFSNPYNASDISVDMLLISPAGKELVLPCFFIKGDSTESIWKARFTPQDTGSYTYSFRVTAQGKSNQSKPETFFSQNSDKKGFLHKNNNWTFVFDNGEIFRGIGENVAWEARNWENSKWTYNYLLPTLSKNGANFFRTWMCAWNLPLEWQQIRDSQRYQSTAEYFNPDGIKRMDQLVEMIDSLNLYLMLTLDWHGALIADNEWKTSTYNKANGGPAATPSEFFTSETAQAKYKNKLRYIIARWGYSTHIAALEFFNEIDNAAFNSHDSILIPHSAIAQWHDEMAMFLKNTDPYNHLVTTSISHRDIMGMNASAYLDFNQKHIYKRTDRLAGTLKTYSASFNKPYVIGEFGYEWDWNIDFKTITNELNFDYKRGLWYGLFNPTPILPMTWWWKFFDEQRMTPYFQNVRTISDLMLKAGNGSFEIIPINAGHLEAYAVKCGNRYFTYILNNTNKQLTSNILLPTLENQAYTLTSFIPEKGFASNTTKLKMTQKGLIIPNFSLKSKQEQVFILDVEKNNIRK